MAGNQEFLDGMGEHDLVIGLGDEQLVANCACGEFLGTIRPDQSLELFFNSWEHHVMTGKFDYPKGL